MVGGGLKGRAQCFENTKTARPGMEIGDEEERRKGSGRGMVCLDSWMALKHEGKKRIGMPQRKRLRPSNITPKKERKRGNWRWGNSPLSCRQNGQRQVFAYKPANQALSPQNFAKLQRLAASVCPQAGDRRRRRFWRGEGIFAAFSFVWRGSSGFVSDSSLRSFFSFKSPLAVSGNQILAGEQSLVDLPGERELYSALCRLKDASQRRKSSWSSLRPRGFG